MHAVVCGDFSGIETSYRRKDPIQMLGYCLGQLDPDKGPVRQDNTGSIGVGGRESTRYSDRDAHRIPFNNHSRAIVNVSAVCRPVFCSVVFRFMPFPCLWCLFGFSVCGFELYGSIAVSASCRVPWKILSVWSIVTYWIKLSHHQRPCPAK